MKCSISIIYVNTPDIKHKKSIDHWVLCKITVKVQNKTPMQLKDEILQPYEHTLK